MYTRKMKESKLFFIKINYQVSLGLNSTNISTLIIHVHLKVLYQLTDPTVKTSNRI